MHYPICIYFARERKRARVKSVSAGKKVERKRTLGPGLNLITSASEYGDGVKRRLRQVRKASALDISIRTVISSLLIAAGRLIYHRWALGMAGWLYLISSAACLQCFCQPFSLTS